MILFGLLLKSHAFCDLSLDLSHLSYLASLNTSIVPIKALKMSLSFFYFGSYKATITAISGDFC